MAPKEKALGGFDEEFLVGLGSCWLEYRMHSLSDLLTHCQANPWNISTNTKNDINFQNVFKQKTTTV